MLSTDQLIQRLSSLSSSKKWLIAFSGGLDSYVLLHALSHYNRQSQSFHLRAIHIDHGLQAVSKQWAQRCQQVCVSLGLECDVVSLGLKIKQGESLEAVARTGRYQAFAKALQADEVLLTAQHQDDQAETVLIQLLRGAGINGLAAMPAISNFANGQHARPLLGVTRESLEAYAKLHALDFIADPSNEDQRFDRNFIRHEIVPRLKARWPSANRVLSRVAQHQAEAKHVLAEYLQHDLLQLTGNREGTLSIKKLRDLSSARCNAVVRYFLAQQGFLAPSEKKLTHIMNDVLAAKQEAMPCVQWQGVEVRRFKDDLYALAPLAPHDATQIIPWNLQVPLSLVSQNRILKPTLVDVINHGSLRNGAVMEAAGVTVRFRQGGEKIYSEARKRTISVKNLMQEHHIPPWERDRIPLIYVGETLVAIATER